MPFFHTFGLNTAFDIALLRLQSFSNQLNMQFGMCHFAYTAKNAIWP